MNNSKKLTREYKDGYDDCFYEINGAINDAIMKNSDEGVAGMIKALVEVQTYMYYSMLELADLEDNVVDDASCETCSTIDFSPWTKKGEWKEVPKEEVDKQVTDLINKLFGGK